ncbi:DUF4185 domain-containing protein [Gynurincola endophyticus]|uniref:DUF4185 domain-containing protein n=1 Tax=Gynurincola endophyticus TaxID=2479004 RepID=UPI000F8D4DDE|nr:DUF4185 domain-containing protein [Gynurincola endophyticus]
MRANLILFALIFILATSSCNSKPSTGEEKANNEFTFTVEKAPEYENWFHRSKDWFGGDGIFMVRKDGVEYASDNSKDDILIWFSDTLLGDIVNGILKWFKMINNSLAIVPPDGSPAFKWDSVQNAAASIVLPTTPKSQEGEYYWLGDGFVNTEKNNDLYVIGYRIKTTAEDVAFAFEERGNTLIVVPSDQWNNWRASRQVDIPFHGDRKITEVPNFGSAILVNTKKAGVKNADGYIYIYGVKGQQKDLMVARVLPKDIEDFGAWRFWDGSEWSNVFDSARAIATEVSNELSISQLSDGRYAMVYQYQTMSPVIGLKLAARPEGPYSDMISLYNVSADIEQDKNIFPYNAKVHTVLSKPNELVISYNVNSFDFFKDIYTYPNLYRPRFIRVKYE